MDKRNEMTLNCNGRLIDLSRPVIMGILNRTPDSFFDGGRFSDENALLTQVEKMIREGAAMIDVGGASTRPGAEEVPQNEELRRVIPAIEAIQKHFPDPVISIDTRRAEVARAAVGSGASVIN